MRRIRDLARCRRGATAIEYGLIISLVVIAMVSALSSVANVTVNMYNHVQSEVSNSTNGVN